MSVYESGMGEMEGKVGMAGLRRVIIGGVKCCFEDLNLSFCSVEKQLLVCSKRCFLVPRSLFPYMAASH